MFKTFKAKIHGTFAVTEGMDSPVIDTTITFTKYKLLLSEDQIGKLYLDPFVAKQIVHKMEYDFDKRLNRNDEKI